MKAEETGLQDHPYQHNKFKLNLNYMRPCLKANKQTSTKPEEESEIKKEGTLKGNRKHLELNNGSKFLKAIIQRPMEKHIECHLSASKCTCTGSQIDRDRMTQRDKETVHQNQVRTSGDGERREDGRRRR